VLLYALRACGAIGNMAVVGQRLCAVTGPIQLRKTSGNRSRPITRHSERSVEGNSGDFKYIQATPITEWDFAPFGQIVRWQEDGKPYDAKDLKLDLSAGEPRLYIFRKREAGLHFSTITYHSQVTQCLKAADDHAWYLAVSAPTFSLEESPTLETIRAFRIEADTIVKLNVGVWHAGPLFEVSFLTMSTLTLISFRAPNSWTSSI